MVSERVVSTNVRATRIPSLASLLSCSTVLKAVLALLVIYGLATQPLPQPVRTR